MLGVSKAYEITDAKIQFVSFVDKAANKRKFLLKKEADGKAAFTTYGRIIKTDMENHYVTGIVYEPMTEDSHGNYMTEEEITKACYWYSENGDKVDLQHSFEPLEDAIVVENWVAKANFQIGDEKIKKGSWLMTVKVKDRNIWKDIENGKITGFSMGGVGNYSEEDVELRNVNKNDKTSEKKSLLKQLAQILGFNLVEKGAMSEIYEERSKGALFWNALDTLQKILYSYDDITGCWKYESDNERVNDALEDFNKIITDILTDDKNSVTKIIQEDSPIKKSGKAMSSKNRETLQCIYDNLGVFLESFKESETKDDDEITQKDIEKIRGENNMTKQEVEEIVAAAIEKNMGTSVQQSQVEPNNITSMEITAEAIEKMVDTAIKKVCMPHKENITAEQIQKMIADSVEKAIEPVLKSRGLPSNLNGNESIEKTAVEKHYLHGIF